MQYPCGTPESAGVSSAGLLETLRELKRFHYLHSFLVIRHNVEVAAAWWKPYNEYTPHRLYSLSKSFISCAVGIAVQEGYLSLSGKLTDIFPELQT